MTPPSLSPRPNPSQEEFVKTQQQAHGADLLRAKRGGEMAAPYTGGLLVASYKGDAIGGAKRGGEMRGAKGGGAFDGGMLGQNEHEQNEQTAGRAEDAQPRGAGPHAPCTCTACCTVHWHAPCTVHMHMHTCCTCTCMHVHGMLACSACVPSHLHAYTRRGGDDFLARLEKVEKAESEASERKPEKAATPLGDIKSAMDDAGGFIANFLGMGGGKEKEPTTKAALYEGSKVGLALHMHGIMHASGDVQRAHTAVISSTAPPNPLRSPMEPSTPRPRWSCR